MSDKSIYLDLFRLDSKKVFIVGGLGLIGQKVTIAMQEAGAEIVVLDINKELAKSFQKEKSEHQGIKFEYFDCSDIKLLEENLKIINKKYGCPDVFINCSLPRSEDFANNNFSDIKLSSLRENTDIHMNSYAWLAISTAELMVKESVKGNIIQYVSTYGLIGQDLSIYEGTDMKENASYALSKGGIVNLTRSMSSYYGQFGIRVNSICPGGVKGHVAGKSMEQHEVFLKNYSKKVPLRRLADSHELAAPTLFLASEASSYITGSTLIVDGGWTAI